jgi:hypothetical protein
MLQLIAQQFGPGLTDPSGYFEKDSATGTNAFSNLEILVSNIIGLLTVLGGLFFVFFFVQGAFQWITAGGDSGKIEKARGQMIQGILGVIVLVASYAIIGLIGTIVGLKLLTPAQTLNNLRPGTSTRGTSAPSAADIARCREEAPDPSVCDDL